ncbi:MAG TPA: FAD:protein FMN transferase [Mycobacteriales bacterium]|jgi:thiamine biosynthesis lipoprotein|nr:FAD:protein FMN transferase [Mycobacteriales bacterium]
MPGPLPTADFSALGCAVRLVVTDPRRLDRGIALLRRQLTEIDAACSRFRPDSELRQLQKRTRPTVLSPLLTEAVAVALRAARLTDGDLDPTVGQAMSMIGYDRDFATVPASGPPARLVVRPVPGWRCVLLDPERRTLRLPVGVQLDLGATAKALAADRAAARLGAALDCGVLVAVGGDIAVAGPAPAYGWPIGLQDAPTGRPSATVTIRSGGLATSSTSVRRWVRGERILHHIVDPRTGVPASTRWRTVSVAARSCVDANIASTTAVIRDAASPLWLEKSRLPARLVDVDGRVRMVAGWPAEAVA